MFQCTEKPESGLMLAEEESDSESMFVSEELPAESAILVEELEEFAEPDMKESKVEAAESHFES